jgi:hypothetical protein
MTRGSCLCGTVRYEVDEPFDSMANCHCSMCRKHHGSAYATFVAAPIAGLRWLAGEDVIVAYASSEQGVRSFCRTCGSVTPMLISDLGLVVCPAGNLEGDLGIKPQGHWFVGSKAPWYAITDHLAQHEAYPPELGVQGLTRPQAEPREGITQGSCLCGDVAFELDGAPLRMWHCHCSRCRRGRSAAHASNVFYRIEQLRFTRGAEQVVGYKLPEAKFFGKSFCRRCGSDMPRIYSERGIAVVPAGSLDTDPGIRAMAHIFAASKASWDDITDQTPQYADGSPPIA